MWSSGLLCLGGGPQGCFVCEAALRVALFVRRPSGLLWVALFVWRPSGLLWVAFFVWRPSGLLWVAFLCGGPQGCFVGVAALRVALRCSFCVPTG